MSPWRGFSVERQIFKCWDDLVQWKALEKMTKSWYVKTRADRNTQQYKSTWFNYNRKFVSKGKGNRAMRSQSSAKTGCSCPAYITTRTDHVTGKVKASTVCIIWATNKKTPTIEYRRRCIHQLLESWLKE